MQSSIIERIIQRDFSPELFSRVLATLEIYGAERWHREVPRVRLAILKLATGDIAQLAQQTRVACSDYRDVLAAAEYPRETAIGFTKVEIKDSEIAAIRSEDRADYLQWLNA